MKMEAILTHKQEIGNAAHKVKEGAMELKDAVVQQSSETLEKACKETETVIKANPYRSVLIAFGIGALMGAVMFRR
jgi:ElaB/YqjD/DUF883 family membrane-anchored ribosome-binding protein